MHKVIGLLTLLIGLAGCTAPPQTTYGNYVANSPKAIDKKIATDAINRLVALYPPASTMFSLRHPTPDAFGTSLVESIRAKGYALLEFNPALQASPVGLPLSYVFDQTKDTNMYRVTLQVGQQTLTRVYVVQANTVHPASNWARKE
jgi:hypothetical protein